MGSIISGQRPWRTAVYPGFPPFTEKANMERQMQIQVRYFLITIMFFHFFFF